MSEIDNAYRALKGLIGGTADILLADYRMRLLNGEVLLQPPSIQQSNPNGEFPIGYAVSGMKALYPFSLSKRDFPQHTLITGSTGTGKTNLALLLIQQLAKAGIPFMIFDFKQSFRSLIAEFPDVHIYTIGKEISPFSVNIIKPLPNANVENHIKKLVPVMDYVFFGGQGTEIINIKALDSILKNLPEGTLADVLFYIQNLQVKWGRKIQSKQSS